jgi:photosystem II stability/assembly factor-like uncharacterized protein
MIMRRRDVLGFALAGCVLPSWANKTSDPLTTPAAAAAVTQLAQAPMTSVARAGDSRIVAAGWRGLVGVSDDAGRSWRQAQVPVSVDLTSICFTNAQHGWAVGMDGVLLESIDGGMSWQKRADGSLAARWMVDKYQAMATANPNDKTVESALNESQAYVKEGPGRPLLDIAFESDEVGYMVGAYGIAFRTADRGKTWEPMIERVENPNGYHLYDIALHRGNVFICGELGTLLRLDRASDRFVKVALPYDGTLFTLVSTKEALVVAGLRGNAFVSHDEGRSWERSNFAGPVPGSFSGGVVMGGNGIVLATQSGQIYRSTDAGRQFRSQPATSPMLYSALLDRGSGSLLTAGSRGLRIETLS